MGELKLLATGEKGGGFNSLHSFVLILGGKINSVFQGGFIAQFYGIVETVKVTGGLLAIGVCICEFQSGVSTLQLS